MTAAFTAPIVVDSLADLEQVHMADAEWGTTAWVKTVPFGTDGGLYVLLKSTALATNGTTVVQAISGSPIAGNAGARWVFVSEPAASPTSVDGFVYVRPIDGVSDDWPTLSAILAANAYKNVVVLLPGLSGEKFQALSKFNIPAGTVLWGTSGVEIQANIPGVSVTDSVLAFYATQGAVLTLAINNTPGSSVIRLTANPGVGTFLQLQATAAHLFGSTYQVVSVAAVGPNFDVTLERAVCYQLIVATAFIVVVTNVPQDIRIVGNGMKITGTAGAAYVFSQGALYCSVSDLILDGSQASGTFAGSGFLYDTMGAFCDAYMIRVIGKAGTPNQVGIFITGEGQIIDNVNVSDCVTGIYLSDCFGTKLSNFSSFNNLALNLSVTSDGGINFLPSSGVVVTDGFCYASGGVGIQIAQGSYDIHLTDVISQFNASNGLLVTNITAAPAGVYVTGCGFTNNTGNGLSDSAGVVGLCLANVDISGNAQAGMLVLSDIKATNIVSRSGNGVACVDVNSGDLVLSVGSLVMDSNGSAGIIQRAGHVVVRDLHITLSQPGTGIQMVGITTTEAMDIRFTANASMQAIVLASATAVASIENVSIDGTSLATSGGITVAAGSTGRLGNRVNMDPCANPFPYIAGSFWNRTLDTAAATSIVIPVGLVVVVAFPDMKQSDRVELVRVVQNGAGVPVPMPLVVKTVGVGFTVTAVAGDAGAVYAYCIH